MDRDHHRYHRYLIICICDKLHSHSELHPVKVALHSHINSKIEAPKLLVVFRRCIPLFQLCTCPYVRRVNAVQLATTTHTLPFELKSRPKRGQCYRTSYSQDLRLQPSSLRLSLPSPRHCIRRDGFGLQYLPKLEQDLRLQDVQDASSKP